jgi:hypothetical protein
MMYLDIFSLFIFVVSILFVLNQIFRIVKNVLSDEPQKVFYGVWEKISNYFFLSYLITYLITNLL